MPIIYEINYRKVFAIGQKSALRAITQAVNEARIVARRNVLWGPYTKGNLARSIYGVVRPRPFGAVGFVGSNLPYAASVEGGARPHIIRAKRPDGYLHFFWTREGRWVRTRFVRHPGQKGKHFLRNALIRVGKRRGFKVIVHD